MQNNPVFARPENGMPEIVANAINQRFINPMNAAQANNIVLGNHPQQQAGWHPQRNIVIVDPVPNDDIITPSTLPIKIGTRL